MNDLDPTARLVELHAATAADLDAVLDVDAGLREVLIASHHWALGRDLDDMLDLAAGLRAILPHFDLPILGQITTPAPHDHGSHEFGRVNGAVARLLLLMDPSSRLAVRHRPALDALATAFAVARARAIALNIAAAYDVGGDTMAIAGIPFTGALAAALDLAVARAHALNVSLDHADDNARVVSAALDIAFASARDLNLNPDVARGRDRALTLNLDLSYIRDLASSIARACKVDQSLDEAIDRDLDRDLDHTLDSTVAGELDLVLDQARHDFVTADLRGVDLTGVRLDRLRWSAATIWPSDDWLTYALVNSSEIAPGLYEIRGGTTIHEPTHTV